MQRLEALPREELEAGLLSMGYHRLADAMVRERVLERIESGELGSEFAVYWMMATEGERHGRYVDVFEKHAHECGEALVGKLVHEIATDKIHTRIKGRMTARLLGKTPRLSAWG